MYGIPNLEECSPDLMQCYSPVLSFPGDVKGIKENCLRIMSEAVCQKNI